MKKRTIFKILALLLFALCLMETAIILKADEFSFINDNAIPLEERKNQINLINIANLDLNKINALIDACCKSDASLAICVFKALQKRDDFKDISILFIKRRLANAQETDANLSEYFNALSQLYLKEMPNSGKDLIDIYRSLSVNFSEIMKEASPSNKVLLFTNNEIENMFLLSGRAEEFFSFLPTLVEYKWSDETAFKKLCNAILEFQERTYPLPEQLFVNLKNALLTINNKEIKDIISLIIKKYDDTKQSEQELTVNDLMNTRIDFQKREAKLQQLMKKTNGLLFTSYPENAPIFIKMLLDNEQEDKIRKRLIDSLLFEMEEDVNLKNPVIFNLYKSIFEKLKENSNLFNQLILGTPSHYMKASKDMYLAVIADKNIPLRSRAAVIFNLSYFRGIDKEKIKRVAIQCLEELSSLTSEHLEEKTEIRDYLIGTLQEFTGEEINHNMSLEEIKRICR